MRVDRPRSQVCHGPSAAAPKNALDWASRPYGQNSLDHVPAGVIGASPGNIGTALAQQSLRGVLSFCNARQMTSPEAYIKYDPAGIRGGR
jgi:chromate reductase